MGGGPLSLRSGTVGGSMPSGGGGGGPTNRRFSNPGVVGPCRSAGFAGGGGTSKGVHFDKDSGMWQVGLCSPSDCRHGPHTRPVERGVAVGWAERALLIRGWCPQGERNCTVFKLFLYHRMCVYVFVLLTLGVLYYKLALPPSSMLWV